MPRPCTPHAAAQLQPIHALRLRRPTRLASSSCGCHEYSQCTRQTSSVVRQHHCLMPPPRGRGIKNLWLCFCGHGICMYVCVIFCHFGVLKNTSLSSSDALHDCITNLYDMIGPWQCHKVATTWNTTDQSCTSTKVLLHVISKPSAVSK